MGRDSAPSASLAFVAPWAADAMFLTVALMWRVPDRRIESKLV